MTTPSPRVWPRATHTLSPAVDDPTARPYDPLRLCVFATVATLGWLIGPAALLFFAALGFTGYWKARRAGLTRSQCLLRDTRLVLGYLAILAIVACAGIFYQLS